jgi:SAM-dependent methyltransferase
MSEQTYALSAEAAEMYESTFVPALFGAWARRLVDTVAPAPGTSVLDVACGTGVVARTAADRVAPAGGEERAREPRSSGQAGPAGGEERACEPRSSGQAGPAGTVVGLDRNEAMLAVARRLRPDLRWQQGDAAALPFDAGSFDLVVSQAGLMFFDDRVAALREMGRVAGAGGRVAVQVPGRLSGSPGYVALTDVVARHAGRDVVDLLGAYFAVGDPDLLGGLFRAAGLRIDRFDTWLGATRLDSIDTFLAVELLPIAERIDPAARERIVAECHGALAGFLDPAGAVAAPIEVHLITARSGG